MEWRFEVQVSRLFFLSTFFLPLLEDPVSLTHISRWKLWLNYRFALTYLGLRGERSKYTERGFEGGDEVD